MSRIFLSHSSVDELEAVALKQWLAANGWDDVFLDTDPQRGLIAGERWQDALRRAADRCEAVVFVVTPTWAKSKWCQAEFLLAKSLNKRIFGVILKPVEIGELPTELTAEWQLCYLVGAGPTSARSFTHRGQSQQIEFLTEGLDRLRIGLENAGLNAGYFPWPPPDDPQRPPFRGLVPLEEKDAAIYFGRDAQIVRGLDALRGMRATGVETLFVILGPSGTGKSSFLRAGLLPRLKRDDRHFLPLDVIRPERHPLTGEYGLAMAIHKARLAHGLSGQTLGAIKAAIEQSPGALASMLAEIHGAARARLVASTHDAPPATLLLSVDQAEELFSPDATDEARRFLTLIGETLRADSPVRPALMVAFTIRSDCYEPLQTAPELSGLKSHVFDELKPMPPPQFKDVITGPAHRATAAGSRLEVKADLVECLLSDCADGADTLPLLALTLARLYQNFGSDGDLRLDEYEAMGGIRGVLNDEIESLLAHDPTERTTQLECLRAAFIPWLATINPQNDEPMRRVARYSDLQPESHKFIDALIAKGLLLTDRREGEKIVEVAHEALLRQWDLLAGWLQAERDDLKLADALERSAQDWEKNDRKPPWLMVGERLSNAETLAVKPAFQNRLNGCREFLLASRQQETRRQAEKERARQAELVAAQKLAMEQTARADAEATARAEAQAGALRVRKRSQALAATSVLMLIALSVAGWALDQANKRYSEATSLRLVAEALGMISGARSGGDERALLQLIVAQRIARGAEVERGQLSVLLQLRDLRKLITSNASFTTVALSPDGTRIVSGSEDRTLRLWDARTGRPIGAPMHGHDLEVNSVAFSPDGTRIVSGSADSTLRLWNAETGQPIGAPLKGHEGWVTSVAFSPDGTRIVSGSNDKTLRLWDTNTGQLIGSPLRGHELWVTSVAFNPDGRSIVSGSGDSTLRLWDANTGQPLGAPLYGDEYGVSSVAFSPDGRRIVAGNGDNTLWLWDAKTGQPVGAPLHGHEGAVNSVAFSPDGHRIVSGSEDQTLRLWDGNTGEPLGAPLQGHKNAVRSVVFSPNGTSIVSGSRDMRVWNASTGQPLGDSLQGHEDRVTSVAFSPDGSRIVSSGMDSTLRLWDANTGQPIGAPLKGHEGWVTSVAFSPDGSRIVSGGMDSTLRLWDANTGQPIGIPLRGHELWVTSVAFSPDGRRIVSGSGDSTLRLWDANTGQPLGAPLYGDEYGVSSVAFSPDGRRIISRSTNHTLRVWDAKTGQPIGTPLHGHEGAVNSVAFSPDGRRIVSGSEDQTLRLWDGNTGEPLGAPLQGHKNAVGSVAFSPNGTAIVIVSGRGDMQLWDASTGRPIGEALQGASVSSVAFSPDGRSIVSGDEDNTLHLWPAPEAWPDELCKKLTRNMSHKEWNEWVSPETDYIEQCPGLPIASD